MASFKKVREAAPAGLFLVVAYGAYLVTAVMA
jgi:hypothetical protein